MGLQVPVYQFQLYQIPAQHLRETMRLSLSTTFAVNILPVRKNELWSSIAHASLCIFQNSCKISRFHDYLYFWGRVKLIAPFTNSEVKEVEGGDIL